MQVLLELRAEGNLAVGLLNQAAGVPDASSLQPLRERFVAALGHIDRMLARLPEAERNGDLGRTTEALVAFGRGGGSIFELRREELRQAATAQDALEASGLLAVRLGDEVASLVAAAQSASDAAALRSAQAIRTGELLLLLITALGIVGAAVIMLQYVVPRVVRPLEAITAAMTALAAGDTSVAIPGRDRRDEIGRMAEALAVFRDTAVEIEEKNLREVAAARQRLIDAIESSSEGFALFDAEDRLVLCNGHYPRALSRSRRRHRSGSSLRRHRPRRRRARRDPRRRGIGGRVARAAARPAPEPARSVRCRRRATAAGSRSTSARPGTAGPSPCSRT